MKNFSVVSTIFTLLLGSCAIQPVRKIASISQLQLTDFSEREKISEIVKTSHAGVEGLCTANTENEICLMNWDQAVAFCKKMGGRLPRARDYANFLILHGIQVIEEKDCKTKAADFYEVFSIHDDAPPDNFCMSHRNYKRPPGEPGNHLLWTSSMPPVSRAYAHVFYDEWGGGGGKKEDHAKAAKNSLQCIFKK